MSDEPIASDFQPEEMLRTLARHQVRHVVIGGIAATLQGSPFPTLDLDICAQSLTENLASLARALENLEAKEWDPRKEVLVERNWDVETISVDDTWILRTRLGALDILFQPAGTRGYSDLVRRRVLVEIDDLQIEVAAIEDVIRMKEAAGRTRDLEQLPTLRKLEERST